MIICDRQADGQTDSQDKNHISLARGIEGGIVKKEIFYTHSAQKHVKHTQCAEIYYTNIHDKLILPYTILQGLWRTVYHTRLSTVNIKYVFLKTKPSMTLSHTVTKYLTMLH